MSFFNKIVLFGLSLHTFNYQRDILNNIHKKTQNQGISGIFACAFILIMGSNLMQQFIHVPNHKKDVVKSSLITNSFDNDTNELLIKNVNFMPSIAVLPFDKERF